MAERPLLFEIGTEDRIGGVGTLPVAACAADEGEAGCRAECGAREGGE